MGEARTTAFDVSTSSRTGFISLSQLPHTTKRLVMQQRKAAMKNIVWIACDENGKPILSAHIPSS